MKTSRVPDPSRRPRVFIATVSTGEAIARELTRRVLDGTLAAGTYLREVELSLEFGVSRQSLRTALADMVNLGLLRREAHRGVWVPVLTKADVSDIFYVRELIESEAARRLSQSPEDWAAVERAVAALESLPKTTPWNEVTEAEVGIHRAIVASTGSQRLVRAYEVINAERELMTALARLTTSKRQIAREHRDLFEVIKQGDPELSVAHLRQHLADGREVTLAQLSDAEVEPVANSQHAKMPSLALRTP